MVSSEQERNASWMENSILIFVPHNQSHHSNYTKIHFQPIDRLPDLKSLSRGAQKTLFAALVISLLIGTYFKFILYRYFWSSRNDKSNNVRNRPINAMILLGAIIHHITNLFMGVNFALLLGFGIHIGEYMGEFYCNLTQFVGVFSIVYLIIGSMSTAILRVLYVKCGMWSKCFIVNKLSIASTLLLGSIFLALVVTILYIIEHSSERVVYNACTGYSTTFQDVIYQYRGHTRVNYNTFVK